MQTVTDSFKNQRTWAHEYLELSAGTYQNTKFEQNFQALKQKKQQNKTSEKNFLQLQTDTDEGFLQQLAKNHPVCP